MDIRADEISRIIRDQIKDYGKKVDVAETGTVLSQADGVARIYGLSGAAAGELLDFGNGVSGLVLNLEDDNVGAAQTNQVDAKCDRFVARGASRHWRVNTCLGADCQANGCSRTIGHQHRDR